MDTMSGDLRSVSNLSAGDIEALLAVLIGSSARVERVALSKRAVWIKRYGTERRSYWQWIQAGFSHLIPFSYLKPSPYLPASGMVEREIRRIALFSERGFATPDLLYASRSAIVLSDVGTTVQRRIDELKTGDAGTHDALLIGCAAELGRLHAAGLCHGRPHPRDMFFADGRLGFMDFEEEPQAVMPLETAQARDIWLLFLQIATRARLAPATLDAAYAAWSQAATAMAIAELRRMMGFLGSLLWLARLIGRVHMGSDLQRFIVATSYLMQACVDSGWQ